MRVSYKWCMMTKIDNNIPRQLMHGLDVNVSYAKGFKRCSNKIGIISEERLYFSLEYECDIYYLLPENYLFALKYANLDIILIESCLDEVTGKWDFVSSQQSKDILKSLAAEAISRNIPVIFWMTKSNTALDLFKDILPIFSKIYCADEAINKSLYNLDYKTDLLQPCVQPAISNPFIIEQMDEDYGFIYDGWVDFDLYKDKLHPLLQLSDFKFSIIETAARVYKSRVSPELENSLLGCVPYKNKFSLLRSSLGLICSKYTNKPGVLLNWMIAEAGACRVPIIFFNENECPEYISDFVLNKTSYKSLFDEAYRIYIDRDYRNKIGHLVWRFINKNHTYSHRLVKVFEDFNIKTDLVTEPLISMIVPTTRPENIRNILHNFYRQTYINKELIIACNHFDKSTIRNSLPDDRKITVINIPDEGYAGLALNVGIRNANGYYVFRIDDDDEYGDNYILDMVLGAKSIDGDFFGKSPQPIKFIESNNIYSRPMEEYKSLSKYELLNSIRWLAGNTFAGKKTFFEVNQFPNFLFGTADTALIQNISFSDNYKILMLDKYNNLSVRSNPETHTWKVTEYQISKKSNLIQSKDEIFL